MGMMGECDWLEPVEGKLKLGGGVKPALKPRLTAFPIRRRYLSKQSAGVLHDQLGDRTLDQRCE